MSFTLASDEPIDEVRYAREVLSFASPKAFAPGAPFQVRGTLDGGVIALAGRAFGSKKRDDGRFDVTGRLVNLRREDRERLERLA